MTYLILYEFRFLRAIYNFTVDAENEQEAVEKLKELKPDAIIRSVTLCS